MTAQRQRVGMAGGKAHRPDHVQRRQRQRGLNKRVQSALDAARREREALDARIAAEQLASLGAGPLLKKVVKHQQREVSHEPSQEEFIRQVEVMVPEMSKNFRALAEADPGRWAAGNGRWSLDDACDLLEQGYLLPQVTRKTGWGPGWFAEKFVFESGYLV